MRILISLLFLTPLFTYAQGIQTWIPSLTSFIIGTLVPFILGIGFLIVTVNIVRYFVIDSTNETGRENAKNYIIYSILAYVVIVAFIGLLNLIINATGLSGATVIPDVPGYPAAGGACNTGDPIADCYCAGGDDSTCLGG